MEQLRILHELLVARQYYSKSFEDFQEQFKDEEYQNKVYGVLNRDNIYTNSKEQFFSDLGLKAKPINEPQKKKIGTTDTDLSSEGGSLASTGIEILPKYVTEQPQQQVPYQFGMEPTSYVGGLEQQQRIQAQQDKEAYDAMQGQMYGALLPVLKPQQLSGVGPLLPKSPEEIADEYEQKKKELFEERVKNVTEDEIEEALVMSTVSKVSSLPGQVSTGGFNVPDYIQEAIKRRNIQIDKYIKKNEEEQLKAQKQTEEKVRIENELAQKDPEFASSIKSLNPQLMIQSEETAVEQLNRLFKKFGFFFEESGYGTDNVLVSTSDGKKQIEIKLGTPSYNESLVSRVDELQKFIYANAKPSSEMGQDFISNALKAKGLRKVGMKNDDGTYSTVLFSQKDNLVFPTLFPKKENYTSNPNDWIDFGDDWEAALAEAKKRGEVFSFKNDYEAIRFADGGWKDVDETYLLGQKFYADRGLDYATERAKYDKFNDVQDEIDVLEKIHSGDHKEIPYSEKLRFSEYFGPDGSPLYYTGSDYTKKKHDALVKERDNLLEQVFDNEFMYEGPITLAREDFDVELEKKRNQLASQSVKLNLEAKKKEQKLSEYVQGVFGVPLKDIGVIKPKTEQEATVLDDIKRSVENIEFTKSNAASNYEESKLYLDAKYNKSLRKAYDDSWNSTLTQIYDAWERGQASEEILFAALGLSDVSDKMTREQIAKEIAERFANLSGEQTRVMTRYSLGRGGSGFKGFIADPAEMSLEVAATSLTQMLPYGIKLILGGGATGAATGAGLGFAGGPLAPATVTGGALVGAGYGARAGMSAAMVGMEYSNAIFDAMREKINPATGQPYDITNPKDVEAALLDTEIWDKGNEIGLKRGLTIGVIDFLAGGLAGRVFNVAKTAPLASRIGVMAAERAIFDPAVEGLGEFAAQVASGQDIDLGEIGLESIGGLGGQAPWMAYNLYVDARNNSVQSHAYTLATDLNALAKESTSDERIVTWTNNLLKLGKIDSDVSQRILENVGLRREARELLGTGTGVLGMKLKSTREAEARTMELLTAKKMLTSNKTKSDLFKDRISKIDSELQKIVDTGKVVPESERVQLNPLGSRHFETPTMTAPGVSHYNIDGTVMTRQQFLDKIENMKSRRLLRSRIQVLNDDETNNLLEEKLLNAFLEQKTGQVPVLAEARTGETVEVGTPQAELEDIAGEGVQAEETLTEAAPEQNETEAIKQDVVSSKTLLEDINSKIPSPIKSWNSGVASALEQGTLSEEEADSALSFLAEKVASKGKLSPQQKAAYDANKKRVDELSGLISQRNDLNTEVSELESILESRKATEAGKPKAAPDFTIDENVDAESANQVREIANRRKLGIPKNREVAFVARDKNGNVIGGAFRSLDKTTNKYSFDVAVSEEAEGRGVGSSLLDSVRNVPFEMRSTAPGATVEVDVVNPAMQQMLRRRGYVVTKRLGGDRVLMAPRKVKKAKVSPKTPEVVSAKNQTAVNELSSRSSRSRRNIIAQATRAVTVLSKILPDLEIFIHETSEEYNDTVSKLNGRENSAGNFAIIGRGSNQKLRIDINLSVANENTVAHEVAHAVMMKAFGEDVRLFKSFRNQISKILDSTTNEQLNQFAARYSEAESHEEFLVELAAVLSNNPQVLEQSLVQKIANAINSVVSRITKGKIVPFSDAANAMQIIDFMNTFAPAMAEGSIIEILKNQTPYSEGIAIRVDPNTFTQTRTRSKSSIGLYKFKSNLKELKFAKLPTYSLKQVIQKYGGRVGIITSDATGYGVDSEGNPIFGGFGYLQNEQNIEGDIAFASIGAETAIKTYTAARNEFGDNQRVLILIMIQTPSTAINNSYGANYFFRGLLELANNSPEEFAKTKESMLKWIDSSAKMKGQVTTKNLRSIIESVNIDGKKGKEALDAYRQELIQKILSETSLDVRKNFMHGILFDLNTTAALSSTTYSKIAFRNIGYTIQNFLSEYGDNTFLTNDMIIDDKAGFVVGGFEINTMTKETAPEFIRSMQSKGITHPLFNGKLPGTNHFVLDGIYGVNENFARFSKSNTVLDESKMTISQRDSLVREIYNKEKFYKKKDKPLDKRGYSELSDTFKIQFKDNYLRPLGVLIPQERDVATDIAGTKPFQLGEGVTPEQIAQAEFVARSKSQQAVEKTANALKDVSDTLTYSYGKNQERYAAYRNAGLIWHGGQSIIRQFDESKIKGGARGVLGYGYYFGNGSKPLDYGLEITFLNAKDLNLIDGDMPPSTDLVNKINNFVKKAKDRGDYSISYYADLMIKEHNNKPDKSIDEIRKTVQMKIQYDTEKFYSTILKELGIDGVQVSNNLQLVLFPDDKLNDLLVDPNIFTSEEYHKAKADKSNPELVKSVEDLIGVPEGQDVVSKSQLPVDEQVKSMSSLLPDELQTMQTIISTGRNNGFSDAAIVEFLKKKGFKVSDIMPQMQLNVDLFTTLPVEFANIEGGATKGMQLFADIRYELSKWVAAQKRNPTNIKFREEAQRILKNHPIYKKQSDSTKMSLQVSFDRSLSKKSDGQIQRRMDTLVNNIKQRKLAEKEFQQAKAKLANIIRSLLPSNEKIDVDALNKILNILSKSTANTIIKDIDTIVPLIEKQRQSIANRLVKDIKKTISDRAKTQKTASGKRRAKGIDEVGQAFFRTALDVLKDILSNNQTKIDERSQKYEDAAVDGTLAELYRKQENNEDLTSQEQELLDEVTAFDLLRDINLMDIEQLNEVMNVLQTVNKEAIKNLKIKRLERSAEFDALNASANNQLRQMFPILFDEDGNPIGKNKLVQLKREIRDLFNRMKVWEGAKKAYAMFSISETNKINGFLRANVSHLGTVCNSLDNIPLGFRFFTDNIYRPLNRAIERMLRGEDIVENYLDAMANSITGITKGRKEIETRLYSMGAVNLETKKGLFNADELLRIYALSLNDIQRDKLDKMGWSANVIEEIKTKLGPEVIEYANMVVEYLSNDYYESVNNVYRYVFNANLNRISNYFPTKTIPTKVDGDMLKNGDFNGIFSADNASALKDRTDTSGEIDLYMGFTVALENHYKSMERFKAFAKTTQNINSIFRNESVIMLMNETGYMKLLRTHINYAINPDAFRSSGTTDDRAVSWFVRKFVGVALGLKVWQASKQAVSSFANAYEKYNYFPSDSKTPNVIKKSLDLPAFMVDSAIVIAQFRKWYNEAYEKSATFRNRAEKSLSGDVVGIESGGNLYVIPESKKTGIIARARRKFRSARGVFTAVGDLAGVLGYMVNYRRNILNGMDTEDAIEEFNEYNQMQQSDRPTEKAPLQQSTFWAARMMTLFGSSTYLMINNIFQSWGNISKSIKAKKMPRSEDMRRFALAYGVSHAFFVLISNFFALTKGDEEDKKRVLGEMRRALLGAENLKTIPWFGASYELVENKMLGIDRPVSQLNDPLLSTATKIYKGIDAGSIWQATKPIAEIVLGVSTDPIVGLNRMFSEGIDEDAMYDIIGISKSYRPGYGQKDTKAEEVMSKEDMKMMYPEIYESTYGTETSKEKDFGIEKYNSGIEEEMKRMKESIFNNK